MLRVAFALLSLTLGCASSQLPRPAAAPATPDPAPMLVIEGHVVLGPWDGQGEYQAPRIEPALEGAIVRDPVPRDARVGTRLELMTADGTRCAAEITEVIVGLSLITDEPLVPPDQDQDCVDEPCPVDPAYAWELARTNAAMSGTEVTFVFGRLAGECASRALIAAPRLDSELRAVPYREPEGEELERILAQFLLSEAGQVEDQRSPEELETEVVSPSVRVFGEGERAVYDVLRNANDGCAVRTFRWLATKAGEETIGDRWAGPIRAVFTSPATELVIWGGPSARDLRDLRRGLTQSYRVYESLCGC